MDEGGYRLKVPFDLFDPYEPITTPLDSVKPKKQSSKSKKDKKNKWTSSLDQSDGKSLKLTLKRVPKQTSYLIKAKHKEPKYKHLNKPSPKIVIVSKPQPFSKKSPTPKTSGKVKISNKTGQPILAKRKGKLFLNKKKKMKIYTLIFPSSLHPHFQHLVQVPAIKTFHQALTLTLRIFHLSLSTQTM